MFNLLEAESMVVMYRYRIQGKAVVLVTTSTLTHSVPSGLTRKTTECKNESWIYHITDNLSPTLMMKMLVSKRKRISKTTAKKTTMARASVQVADSGVS